MKNGKSEIRTERHKDCNVFVLVGHPRSLYGEEMNVEWILRKQARRNFIFRQLYHSAWAQ